MDAVKPPSELLDPDEYTALRAQTIREFEGSDLPGDAVKLQLVYELLAQLVENFPDSCDGLVYFMLGRCYHFKSEKEKSLAYFVQALAKGRTDAESVTCLGQHYFHGCGVPVNYKTAYCYFEAGAQSNISLAVFSLGVMHSAGDHVPQDRKKAVEFYEKVVALGGTKVKSAQYNLGLRFLAGEGGVPQDSDKALHYFLQAAEKGSIRAHNELGKMFDTGQGVTADSTKAFAYYLYAADKGHQKAQFKIGNRYSRGIGVPRNAAKSLEYFEMAAAQGNVNAQYNVGNAYSRASNHTKAVGFYLQAANAGNPKAQNALGHRLLDGLGTPRNVTLAIHYLTLSSDQGEASASYELGCRYALMGGSDSAIGGYAYLSLSLHYLKVASEQLPNANYIKLKMNSVSRLFAGFQPYEEEFARYQKTTPMRGLVHSSNIKVEEDDDVPVYF